MSDFASAVGRDESSALEGGCSPSFFAEIAEPHFDTGCKRPLTGFVGRLPVVLSSTPDERREYLISTYGYLLEQCMAVVDEEGDAAEQLTWRMRADICKQQMESLIASRRPEYVRSLEVQRGLI